MVPRALPWLVALLTLALGHSAAQAFCFWPTAPPRCSSWFVTEAGVLWRSSDLHTGDEHTLFAYSLGWMHNDRGRGAWGAELFGGAEGELRGGLALRGRRWLSPSAAADLAVGVHLLGDASSQHVRTGSPMLSARIGYRDVIAASARLDVLRLRCGPYCTPGYTPNPPNGTSTRFYLGAEVGSGLGLAAHLATGLLVGLFVLAWP